MLWLKVRSSNGKVGVGGDKESGERWDRGGKRYG